MLKSMRGGQRWLTAIFVALIGGVFVLFLGLQGPLNIASTDRIVAVGPYEFGLREFERARANRERAIQAQLGDQYDSTALRETLDNLAARELVDRALLALAGEELGLTVSKREVERFVLSDPGFRGEDGRFDREAFERYTEYEYGSHTAFLADRRMTLLSLKMLRLLNQQPEVSRGEAEDALRRELEQVRIAFVAFDARAGDDEEVPVSPEEIAAALEDRGDELQELYDERAGEFNQPEQVKARHILRTVDRGADPAEVERVRGELQAARDRITGGEDFATVASELSEDPGSQARGGDLGFFGRGQMVPEFEETAFTLEPGTLSELVQTDYGFHLIEVQEKKAAVNRSFEEAREELAADLLRGEVVSAAARKDAEALAAKVREGESLEAAARAADLPIERSGWLPRRPDGFVPQLGAAQDLMAAAFNLEPGTSSPRVFEVGQRLALVQLLERKLPEPAEIEPRIPEKQAQLLTEKRNSRASDWVNERRKELVESGQLVVNLDVLRGA